MPKRPTIYDLNIGDGGALVFTPVTFPDGDATPLVDGGNVFITANTSLTTITDFLNGADGQEIEVKVAGNTTIEHNDNIKLEGGQDILGVGSSFVGDENLIIKLRRYSGVWVQNGPVCITGAPTQPGGGEEIGSPVDSPIGVVTGSPTDVVDASPIPNVGSPSTGLGIGVYYEGGRWPDTKDGPYTSWLGRSVDVHVDALHNNSDFNSWTFATNPGAINSYSVWGSWMASHPSRRFELALAMCPWSSAGTDFKGALLDEVAAGTHDSKFQTLANYLVNVGLGGTASQPVYIRLGPEMSGTWFPWGVGNNAVLMNDYKNAWRQIVAVMRAAQPSNNWKWFFCPATRDYRNFGVSWAEAIYPGDDVVDLVGGDFYDNASITYTSTPTDAQRLSVWTNVHLPALQNQNTFATNHSKRQAFGEWALLLDRPTNIQGGGDNPLFINNTFTWITSHDFEFVNYFDDTTPTFYHSLSVSTQFPNAAAAYIQKFSSLPHPW